MTLRVPVGRPEGLHLLELLPGPSSIPVLCPQASVEISSRFDARVTRIHFSKGDIVKVRQFSVLVDDCQDTAGDTPSRPCLASCHGAHVPLSNHWDN